MVRKLVLDNGVRVIAERMPSVKSVTIGIWVNVGSRDEEPHEAGLSHFLEHMFFKGTARRSATDISHEIDALGGELNAFTTRETTTFYVKVLDQHFKPALALLTDLFHHASFDERELEKEKQVVLEEIRMVEDDPEDLVQDLHAEQVLTAHPLGRPILGDARIIKQLRRQQLVDYVQRRYHPLQTIIAIAGNFDPKACLPLVQRSFRRFRRPGGPALRRWPPLMSGGLHIRQKRLEQAHLCIGFPGVRADHKDRYAAHVLNAILGGSVSSRLFQVIREREGLAYSVYSYVSAYSDAGAFTIFAASRPKQAPRVVELIRAELLRLRRDGVTAKELARAKNHLKGTVMLSLDSTSSRMSKLAKDELFEGRYVPLDEVLRHIDQVSRDHVLRLAHELIDPNRLSLTALGPVSPRALSTCFDRTPRGRSR